MPTPTSLPNSFTAGDVLTAANLNLLRGGFRILRVSQATKTDTQDITSTTAVDVTGLSVTITPQSNTSKFLLFAQVSAATASGMEGALKFTGGNSTAYVGDTASNRQRVGVGVDYGTNVARSLIMAYLDSPATASAITYKVQGLCMSAGNLYINRSAVDSDTTAFGRYASSLIVLEVSA